MNIILASQSPRRRELLEQVGITGFQVISPDVDERVEPGLSPAGMVEELSLRKPRDGADAFAMLSALSGREHRVYTGVSVLRGDRAVTEHEETAVCFRALAPGEIWGYIATGEPMDKAGAYGIQGIGALLVSGIRGDYCNVVGLPVFRLGRMLREFGIELLRSAEPQ